MKICIILNGEIKDYNKVKKYIKSENYDYIICADGGSNHAYNMGITPNYIMGDLDSIKSEVLSFYKTCDVEFKQVPAIKDETDSELCIRIAETLKATSIDFIGALGGRMDHTLANINLLYYTRERGIIPRITSETEQIYIAVNEEVVINGKMGDIISVIPVNGDAKGVSLDKLEYPLNNYTMKHSMSLGISNIMLEEECIIKVKEGSLLIIKNM